MKKRTLMLLIALFCSSATYAQTESYAPFSIMGKVRKLVSTIDNKENVRLSCGDKVSIGYHADTWFIRIEHGKITKVIAELGRSTEQGEETYVEVFEYDFDDDGTKEFCIAYQEETMGFKMAVYRYTGGLAELVGNFDGQGLCEIKNNRIEFAFGMQGIVETYLYENGIFFELVIHDPNQKIKQ